MHACSWPINLFNTRTPAKLNNTISFISKIDENKVDCWQNV